jgi:AhpD family alkylhydroperoxidase
MNKRIMIQKVDPEAYQVMAGFDHYLNNSELAASHKELIKIRASQMNGCAYCIDLHTKDARKDGETEQRIYALSAWRDTPYFTAEERAILAITEEVTLIQSRVSDETYETALRLLGEKYLAQVMMAAIAINAWNRIGIATNMMPPLN